MNKETIETIDATYQWKYGVNVSEITNNISVDQIDPTITSTES